MRLYLAIAALMLVLIAHSEAVEEPTIEKHFANIHEKIKEFGETFGEKATNAWRQLETSDFISKSSDWFTEQFQNIKQKFDDTFNKPE